MERIVEGEKPRRGVKFQVPPLAFGELRLLLVLLLQRTQRVLNKS